MPPLLPSPLHALPRLLLVACTPLIAIAIGGTAVLAQDTRRPQATRAELEALAVRAEQAADSAAPATRSALLAEVARLRGRLRDGDLLVGDRIAIVVAGQPALSDTFTVRTGRLLKLPDVPEIPLEGVLRSELQQHLATHIGRLIRTPSVQAVALIRVAVLGEVRNPSFYAVPADLPLTDLLTTAGGLTAEADLARTSVRRAGTEIVAPPDASRALAAGTTLDQLDMRGGDEFVVGRRRQVNWSQILSGAAVVGGLIATLVALGR